MILQSGQKTVFFFANTHLPFFACTADPRLFCSERRRTWPTLEKTDRHLT